MPLTHETVDECLDSGDYQPGKTGNTVIKESTDDELHRRTVECPVCGRQYDYVYLRMGFFDRDKDAYVAPPDQFTVQASDAYHGEEAYRVPVETDTEQNLEIVYRVDTLKHEGRVIQRFDQGTAVLP